jgi:hypothetical protein
MIDRSDTSIGGGDSAMRKIFTLSLIAFTSSLLLVSVATRVSHASATSGTLKNKTRRIRADAGQKRFGDCVQHSGIITFSSVAKRNCFCTAVFKPAELRPTFAQLFRKKTRSLALGNGPWNSVKRKDWEMMMLA